MHPIIDLNGRSEELQVKNHLFKFLHDPTVNRLEIATLPRQLEIEKQSGIQRPTPSVQCPAPTILVPSTQRFCNSVSIVTPNGPKLHPTKMHKLKTL